MPTAIEKICAGDLKHRVTIQEPANKSDGIGGNLHRWEDVVTTFMAMESSTGKEAMLAMQNKAPVTVRFLMRYRPAVKASMRLKMLGPYGKVRLFNIRYVNDLEERHLWLELTAEENVAAA